MESVGYSYEQRPLVALFAESPDALEISILENLLSNFCRVRVFTEGVDFWRIKTKHLRESKYLEILPFDASQNFLDVSYIVSVNKKNLENSFAKIRWIGELSKKNYAKTFFILPLVFESKEEKSLAEDIRVLFLGTENIGLIYIGDTIGPRMILEKDFVSKTFKDLILDKKIRAPNLDFYIYPTFPYDAGRVIVRLLFSFGPYGDELALAGTPLKFSTFLSILTKKVPGLVIVSSSDQPKRYVLNTKKRETLKTQLMDILTEALGWFYLNPPPREARKIELKIPEVKNWAILSLIVLMFSLVLPFFLLFLSTTSLIFTKTQLIKGNIRLAKTTLLTSEVLLIFPTKELAIISRAPLVGKVFDSTYTFSVFLQKTVLVFKETTAAYEYASDLFEKILGEESYDPTYYSEKIYLSLDKIYRDTSFLQSEISTLGIYSGLVRRIGDEVKISGVREKIFLAKNVVSEIPWILGNESTRTFLVLFQNNMELRPTGGFIGSFGLLTFDKGKLKDISVYDVYSADGQLKGYVEPPLPIKNYLGEASWYLRDANWDPDFPTSAGRIEWFLDKELGQSVDGVFAIDLNVVESLIRDIGPVRLPELGREINSENLYETLQEEAEEDFFPGSRKKAGVLTSLTNQIMLEVSNLKPKGHMPLLISLVRNLEERHIQLFIHEQEVQKSLSSMGFAGEVSYPSCDIQNCFADFVGVVEANLGVNKANYFIKRKMTLETFFEQGIIKKKLVLEYENSGNPVLGQKALYKVYIRVTSPINSVFNDVETKTGLGSQTLTSEIEDVHGRKEAGVLVEVPAGTSRSVIFSWSQKNSLDFTNRGEYRFYFRKQAGTDADPVSINLIPPFGLSLKDISDGFLTKGNIYTYNTTLARDIFSRISW